GAGTMGHGIAHAAAAAGFETAMYDVTRGAVEKGRARIADILKKGVDLGKVTQVDADAALGRLRISDSLQDVLTDTDFVIEAAPEKIDLKLHLMAEIDAHAPAHAIVTTNTSALSITEMAGASTNPGRVAGMHFFNPVHRMKLIEIVRALESTPATLEAVEAVSKQMGKETVVVRESPGFITTRVNASLGNEAFFMLMEGVASARDIDKALKLGLNHPMGPFELVDLVGLDTRLSILEYLHRSMGEKYRPCPLLHQYVKAGRLGRKVGRGVYEY
ncbi:MAG TPA: 3-hydroxyacyl-CoA dehydrogenase NAD-binding domain-containing protein, partial [Vicinamibacterales bacterium]|nr:3-hydroxyacyl-CoA dehydrogenase NAD-binding domain-containing protein [Vicinamibacterales bacterium]